MKFWKKSFAVLGLSATILSLPLLSLAGESKSYNGALCQGVWGDKAEISYGTTGRAHNTDTSTARQVVCPVDMDYGRAIQWDVTVRDGHASQGVECRGIATTKDGSEYGATSQQSSAGVGHRTMHLGAVDKYVTWGSYGLLCKLPPLGKYYSAVDSYMVLEDR